MLKTILPVLLSTTLLACAGTNPEPKTAGASASVQADAGLSQPQPQTDQEAPPQKADAGTAAVPDAEADAKPADVNDAQAADAGAPDAPESAPPSEKPPVIQVVLNGLTTEVVDGQTYAITSDRMLFFYSSAAAPDCSNVAVTNLVKRPLAGLCQIGFLPQEQKLKKNDERPASITVGNTTRSFRVMAL